MPRSTISEPHEYALLAAVSQFAIRELGDEGCGFLLLFGPGHELSARFVYGDDWPDPDRRKQLIEDSLGHIFYDPFDFPEYGWVQWHNVPRAVFESTVGSLVGPGSEGYADSGSFMV